MPRHDRKDTTVTSKFSASLRFSYETATKYVLQSNSNRLFKYITLAVKQLG